MKVSQVVKLLKGYVQGMGKLQLANTSAEDIHVINFNMQLFALYTSKGGTTRCHHLHHLL